MVGGLRESNIRILLRCTIKYIHVIVNLDFMCNFIIVLKISSKHKEAFKLRAPVKPIHSFNCIASNKRQIFE